MGPTIEAIFQTAASLSEPERVLLIEELRKTLSKPEPAPNPTDAWMDEIEVLASQLDPEDDELLAVAIAAIRKEAKEMARQGKR